MGALAGLGAAVASLVRALGKCLANLLFSYGGRRSRACHTARQNLNKFVPSSSAKGQIFYVFVRQETNLSLSRPPGDKFAGPGGRRGRAGPELRKDKVCSQRSGRLAPGHKLLLAICHPAPLGACAGRPKGDRWTAFRGIWGGFSSHLPSCSKGSLQNA